MVVRSPHSLAACTKGEPQPKYDRFGTCSSRIRLRRFKRIQNPTEICMYSCVRSTLYVHFLMYIYQLYNKQILVQYFNGVNSHTQFKRCVQNHEKVIRATTAPEAHSLPEAWHFFEASRFQLSRFQCTIHVCLQSYFQIKWDLKTELNATFADIINDLNQ